MSEPLVFSMSGKPRGKGRPRTAVRGRFATIYTDKLTRTYEADVKAVARDAMGQRLPFQGALTLSLRFRVPIPKSETKATRAAMAAGEIAPTTKPDWDNAAKAICDGMNGVVYRDDCQIVRAFVTKVYHPTPGVDVRVAPLDVEAEPSTPAPRSAT